MRKLSHLELLHRQKEKAAQARLPFCVILNNIRSLHNVGSLFRTAEGCGLEKIWLCGITGIPPDTKISKTALGAEESMPWEYRENASPLVTELGSLGYQIVLLEQTPQSIPYQELKPKPPVCLVIGNEITGVCDSLMGMAETAIEIEMAGVKNSLNVAVAFGIAAYHIRNQLKYSCPSI